MTAPTWVLLNKDLRAWERRVRLYGLDPKDQPSAEWWEIDEDGMIRPALFTVDVAVALFRAYAMGLA